MEDDYFVAIEARDTAAIRRMCTARKNVHVTAADQHHRTPLHICVWMDYVEGAKLIIDAGADINALDDIHDTPFLIAGSEGRVEILQHMIKNAEKVKKFGSATSRRFKLAIPDYTVVNRFGSSALHGACDRGYVNAVSLLVENGLDLNQYNNNQWTPLLETLHLGGDDRDHVTIVELLVRSGADVNLADADGQTPLKLARQHAFKRIETILSTAGAHE